MSYLPLNFDKINLYEGLKSPSTYNNRNNLSYDYWYRQLFLRLKGNLKFNLDGIDEKGQDFIITVLLIRGFAGFAKDNEIGVFGQICTPKKYNFYYQPQQFIVTNPYWKKIGKSKTYTCGEDGVIVRLLPDYMGMHDILSYYAEKLSTLDVALNTSLINAKIPHVFGGKNKSAVLAIKKMMDKVNKGESAVYYDSRISDSNEDSPFQFIELFKRDKYITDLLLADRQTIIHDFDTEIGIKSIPYNKKERLSTDEVNIKEDESNTKLQVMIDSLNADFDAVNKMFNTDYSVIKNETVKEEVEQDESRNLDDTRTI